MGKLQQHGSSFFVVCFLPIFESWTKTLVLNAESFWWKLLKKHQCWMHVVSISSIKLLLLQFPGNFRSLWKSHVSAGRGRCFQSELWRKWQNVILSFSKMRATDDILFGLLHFVPALNEWQSNVIFTLSLFRESQDFQFLRLTSWETTILVSKLIWDPAMVKHVLGTCQKIAQKRWNHCLCFWTGTWSLNARPALDNRKISCAWQEEIGPYALLTNRMYTAPRITDRYVGKLIALFDPGVVPSICILYEVIPGVNAQGCFLLGSQAVVIFHSLHQQASSWTSVFPTPGFLFHLPTEHLYFNTRLLECPWKSKESSA